MTDIILVVPPQSSISVTPPLGLGYLASSLRHKGYGCKILDFAKDKRTVYEAADMILNENPHFVGMSCLTYNYNKAKELIRIIKYRSPKVKVIIGGVHVSALPEFSLKDSKADFAVVGEGEEAICEIADICDYRGKGFGNVKGIVFRENGNIIFNPGCNIIDDLDRLPFPAWDLITPQSYQDSPGYFYSKGTSFPIITSRGCPHHCSFCASRVAHGMRLRLRGPKNIVDEMEMLVKDFGVRDFDFCDDSFTENKAHAVAVCDEIIKRGLHISWKTPVGIRLDSIDEGLLAVMKRAGCYELGFGVESYDEEVLRINKKPLARTKIIEKLRLVKQFGIETIGFFILGLPGDTKKAILDTVAFAKKSPFDLISFSCAVPVPGTEIFERIYTQDNLHNIDWERFTFNNQFNLSELSRRALRSLFRKAIITTYSKPSRFIHLIKVFSKLKPFGLIKVLRYIIHFLIR